MSVLFTAGVFYLFIFFFGESKSYEALSTFTVRPRDSYRKRFQWGPIHYCQIIKLCHRCSRRLENGQAQVEQATIPAYQTVLPLGY